MNTFVADPQWGWWIILYFYLGGLAAGCYFLATLVELFGDEGDQAVARIGFRLAFPLIMICGLFLTIDLERPEYFWHMLLQSEVVDRSLEAGWPLDGWSEVPDFPLFKWWSPMSIGAWAITLFGICSGLSFLTTLWPQGRVARVLGRGWFGRAFQIIGCGVGFFVASYTGVLLTASNQPTWSITTWIGPLFLTSAASTGIAAVLLLGHWSRSLSPDTLERLERADLWALGLELLVFLIFLASLGNALWFTAHTTAGMLLIGGTLVLGLLLPLGLHLGVGDVQSWRIQAAAASCLVGGFLLRYGIVRTPPELLAQFDGRYAEPSQSPLWQSWEGVALLILTLVLAVAIPLVLRRQWRLRIAQTALAGAASLVAVIGVAFFLVQTPTEVGFDPLSQVRFSPEVDRPRGGGVGASSSNRPVNVRMRTKFQSAP
jgi:formate-dependent nitrite reductase membrane component NrfD